MSRLSGWTARVPRRAGGVEGPTAPWQTSPVPRNLRPDLVAAVAASERLRSGLADQWHQRPMRPDALAVAGADLLLVELADGVVPGLGRPEDAPVAALVEAAAHHRVPLVVWVTSGRPPVDHVAVAATTRLFDAAAAVHVVDLVDAWRELAPEAGVLRPAAPARRPPASDRTRGGGEPSALVVSPGPSDEQAAGPVAAVLGPALRAVQDRLDVLLLDHQLPARGVLPGALAAHARSGAHPDVTAAIARAAVVVDGPRRTPGDTWTVLEAAAAGTSVVSVAGLSAPSGLPVVAPDSPTGLRSEVVARLHQSELRDREALVQRRAVLAGHTFGHRVPTLLASVGLAEPEIAAPAVSAVVSTNRRHELDNVLANAGRQDHRSLELVLVLHGFGVPVAELRARARDYGVAHLEVVRAPGHLTLGSCLNRGIDAAGGDLVAKMDDDNHYGRHYLSDLVAALRAQGAGVAGKWAHYVWLRSTGAVVLRYPDLEHAWTRRIQGGSMLLSDEVARGLRFADLPRGVDSDLLDRAIEAGVPIWSADRFNFVSVRGDDRGAHTWTVEDATFLTGSGRLAFFGDPRPHVEV